MRGFAANATAAKQGGSPNQRVAIVDGVRIPFAKSLTKYNDAMPYDLARDAIKGILNKTALQPNDVDYVLMGTVAQDVNTSNLAREAALGAGLPKSVPSHTITQACISSSQAIASGADKILVGKADVVIAGGADTLSDAPIRYSRPLRERMLKAGKAMKGGPMGILKLLRGLKLKDFAPEAPSIKNFHTQELMGQSSDRLAARFGVTREEQDMFAINSHRKAHKAHSEGLYNGEIVPIGGSTEENGVQSESNYEKISKLKPAFIKPHGTHTSANSSFLSDGAATTLLMSESKAKELGYKPKAFIKDYEFVAVDPFEELLLGPAYAISNLLAKNNLTFDDIDVFEIHEAFAGQILANLKALEDPKFSKESLGRDKPLGSIDPTKLNQWGGSLALGHPFGATGSRLVNTAANILQKNGGKYALVSACADSGLAQATLIERSD